MGPQWGRDVFLPTNPGVADIVVRTDFDFAIIFLGVLYFSFPQTRGSGPKSLREPVLHDRLIALSNDTNQYPFWTVRTPQASLVGEQPTRIKDLVQDQNLIQDLD